MRGWGRERRKRKKKRKNNKKKNIWMKKRGNKQEGRLDAFICDLLCATHPTRD